MAECYSFDATGSIATVKAKCCVCNSAVAANVLLTHSASYLLCDECWEAAGRFVAVAIQVLSASLEADREISAGDTMEAAHEALDAEEHMAYSETGGFDDGKENV